MPDSNQMIGDDLSKIPICVDLDGTLVKTDILYESILWLVAKQPYCIFLLPFWLLGGKANLKSQIAIRLNLSEIQVPFNEDVVDFVRSSRKTRKTILVTGTHQSLANLIAKHCDLFDEVYGTTAEINLTGERKKAFLIERFGKNGFDYIGNEKADIPVWSEAREALIASPASKIAKLSGTTFSKKFEVPEISWKDYFKLIRVHQWSKNALIFVPFLLEYRFNDPGAAFTVFFAFLAMSFLASATYIVNDMLDLASDRQNETKRKRVLASGQLPLLHGIKTMFVLFILTLVLAAFLPWELGASLIVYLIFTLTYSFFLKRKSILDVISIAALHTLRIVAGTVVIQAQWSFWLLAFSMFIFFSLAIAKRVAELVNLKKSTRKKTIGRDYHVEDIPILTAIGVSTGFISVLVVALYINSDKVQNLYAHPMVLWLLCPVLMYWIGRIWMISSRGRLHEDPIVFAMKDRTSLFTAAVLATTVIAAMFLGVVQ